MRHSTGIGQLDRTLDGGIPPGDMVAFTAPADAQAELILEALVGERDTVFVSTMRTTAEAKKTLADAGADLSSLRVHRVDPEDVIADPHRYIGQLGERSNLVLEGISAMETADRNEYLAFLDAVKGQVSNTASMGVLFGIDREHNMPPRRSLTLHRADHVWRLYQELTSQGIETTLTIPKFRGGRAVVEPIRLRLTDRVKIDTSRDIA